jgi:ribosomal protein L7/L12
MRNLDNSLVAELARKHITEIDNQIADLRNQVEALYNLRNDYIGELDEINRAIERYPVSLDEIRAVAETEGKLNAVKRLKEVTGFSLMDAKRTVEMLADYHGWSYPDR